VTLIKRLHQTWAHDNAAIRFEAADALEAGNKEAFLAGFDAGAKDTEDSGVIIDEDFYREVTDEAYEKYREEE
jgi:hypothetical protein